MSFHEVNQTTGELNQLAGNIITAVYAEAPVGAIIPYGGAQPPVGWFLCDGTELLRADYPDLFAVIGTSFGTPSVNTKFKLPDLRGEFLRGAGTNGHTGQGSGGSVGEHQDASAITQPYATGQSLGVHGMAVGSSFYSMVANKDGVVSATVDYLGGQQVALSTELTRNADSVRPTNTSVNYIIKALVTALPTDFEEALTLKQNKVLDTPITSNGEVRTTVEDALGAEAKIGDLMINDLGSKNLFHFPYAGGKTLTFNGVVFTQNDDGSVTVNGTATGGNAVYSLVDWSFGADTIKRYAGKKIRITGGSAIGTISSWFKDTLSASDTGSGVTYTIPANVASIPSWNISILIPTGQTADNLTIYPLLTLFGVEDRTYKPYAMTTQELTKDMYYSTTELDTGKYWIDGKKIYRKVFTGTLPAGAGDYGFYHSISNLGQVIHFEGMTAPDNNGAMRQMDFCYYNSADWDCCLYIDATRILVQKGSSYASYHGNRAYYITVEYTKTA